MLNIKQRPYDALNATPKTSNSMNRLNNMLSILLFHDNSSLMESAITNTIDPGTADQNNLDLIGNPLMTGKKKNAKVKNPPPTIPNLRNLSASLIYIYYLRFSLKYLFRKLQWYMSVVFQKLCHLSESL